MGELAAAIYGHPGEGLLQIGITGTSGKTTTAYLVEGGLRAAGRSTGLVGTVEMRIGDERIKSERTTPEATDLQALFAVMRERGVEAVAMEVSSHALVLGRVDGSVFDVAVFNNLSPEHMEFHSDMDDYFQAKAGLFTPAGPAWAWSTSTTSTAAASPRRRRSRSSPSPRRVTPPPTGAPRTWSSVRRAPR